MTDTIFNDRDVEQLRKRIAATYGKRIYLACPYSSDFEEVRRARWDIATRVAQILIQHGILVFSPLTMTVPMERKWLDPHDRRVWMTLDLSFLEHWAEEIWVLVLPGWVCSPGVREECEISDSYGLPTHFLDVALLERLLYPKSEKGRF